MLALTANELAFIGAGSHSIAAFSHYLHMKTAIRAEPDVAFPKKIFACLPLV